jgi:hypothetical protein
MHRFVNVEHDALYHALRLRFAHAQHLELAEFIFAANDDTDLGCAYVESDYNLFLFHGCKYFVIVAVAVLNYLFCYLMLHVSDFRHWALGIAESTLSVRRKNVCAPTFLISSSITPSTMALSNFQFLITNF